MNVLILGSGGREHVFARKIQMSRQCSKLFIAPGNAGTAQCGNNVAISPMDFEAVAEFCRKEKIEMIIPGNEDPLVAGIVDFFSALPDLKHIQIAGPDKAGARLEGSKDFSKEFMKKYSVPTADYFSVSIDNLDEGLKFLETLQAPYVLKADGLAAGKGVLIETEIEQAKQALKEMLSGKFGASSKKVVLEEYLHGIELSCFVLCDGSNYLILPEAKDYKRIGENDQGLNTGGMGAVSPVPFADSEFLKKVEDRIIKPSIEGLKREGIHYKGFLFIGLMNVNGDPKVIEYNCRMGDPETEVVVHRINTDLLELFKATCDGTLNSIHLDINPDTAATVFLVSGGYPEEFEKGLEMTGFDQVSDSIMYHAGTKPENGKILTNGGRVLAITSTAGNLRDALSLSMKNAEKIQYKNKYYRKDIGQDLMKFYEQV